MTITTKLHIETEDGEIEVEAVGDYTKGCRGVKAHPMDRFTPPDDDPEMELTDVFHNGKPIETTQEQNEKAIEALWSELDARREDAQELRSQNY